MEDYINVNDETISHVKKRLADCITLLETYQWIIDSFVLDFFLDSSLWLQLSDSWRSTLSSASPESLASLLDQSTAPRQQTVWPLSLLAFKQSIHTLALNRNQVKDFRFAEKFLNKNLKSEKYPNLSDRHNGNFNEELQPQFKKGVQRFEFYEEMFSVFSGHQSSLKHIFRKHVKPKKQYELARLGKLIKDTMSYRNQDRLIDVGAGVGHLARYLAYAHKLQVACVDCNSDFTDAANKFDSQLEQSVDRLRDKLEKQNQNLQESHQKLPDIPDTCKPVHVTSYLDPAMDLDAFHTILAKKFCTSDIDLRYGIVGLHTCGDLACVLIKVFINDPKAVMLHSVGCCYMKVQQHFPMSHYVSTINTNWKFNYTNAELACHAIEMYRDRLCAGEQDKLKVHCYRAVLEKILVTKDQSLRHTILKTVARAHQISFQDYAIKATSNLTVKFGPEEFCTDEINEELESWWKVVVYYTIRLSLAPVLETVILLDRCISLYENGHSSLLIPLFDPVLSPRNNIIFAAKNST